MVELGVRDELSALIVADVIRSRRDLAIPPVNNRMRYGPSLLYLDKQNLSSITRKKCMTEFGRRAAVVAVDVGDAPGQGILVIE